MRIGCTFRQPLIQCLTTLMILFPSLGVSQTWRDTLQHAIVAGVGVSRNGTVGETPNNAIVEQRIRFHMKEEKLQRGESVSHVAGTTFFVTTTEDTGEGSFRKAIIDANTSPGRDLIAFNIPPGGQQMIIPRSKLPNIVDSVIIDGTTQPGYVDLPMIELRFSAMGAYDGLDMYAGNSTVRGLVMNGLTGGSAIALWVNGGNVIEGNFIGTNRWGDQIIGNVWNAVFVKSTRNRIGGTTPAARNVFSGNGYGYPSIAFVAGAGEDLVQGNYFGTDLTGHSLLAGSPGVLCDFGTTKDTIGGTDPSARNIISGALAPYSGIDIAAHEANSTGKIVILGNFIGTDVTGTRDFGNGGNGIHIINSPDNIIGGTEPGARNVISGNTLPGVSIQFELSSNNIVQGNYIGTDSSGMLTLGNSQVGVLIDKSPNNLIGGLATGAGNVISGNGLGGIAIRETTASGNQVQGNLIGTKSNGVNSLPNGTRGVWLIRTTRNTIGGPVREAGNVIAGNFGNGITIEGVGSWGNTIQNNFIGTDTSGKTSLGNFGSGVFVSDGDKHMIRYNRIYSNGGLGIDLGSAGVTRNDSLDPDEGANNLQNFPILDSATISSGSIRIRGKLDGRPTSLYHLDFFRNDARNSSHFGEGQTLIGSAVLLSGPDGRVDVNVTFSAVVTTNQFITATATDADGNISEFSRALCLSDIDGDGIFDCWETNGDGIDVNADGVIDLDLYARGARPDHKDLFVEVDFMDTYEPSDVDVLAPVRAAFHQASNYLVNNPDGNNGIDLHTELEQADVIPQTVWAADPWPEFLAAKKAHFGTTEDRADTNGRYILEAKKLVYRYCIFARAFGPLANTTSGLTRTIPGNDFFVSLGRWNTPGGTHEEQAGIFMHELGHSLGLRHGGGDGINYKPNYYSVMNYLFSTPTNAHQPGAWKLDYSPTVLNYLEEGHLPEFLGLMSAGSVGWYPVVQIPYRRPDNTIAQATLKSNTAVDWDGNGDSTFYATFPVDVNHIELTQPSSPLEALYGYADWPNLIYNFRAHQGPSGSPQVSGSHAQEDFGELTQEQVDSLRMLPPYGIVEPLNRWPSDANANIPISTATSHQSSLVMTGDGRGGAIIAYSSTPIFGGLPGDSTDVYAQHVDSLGNVLWRNNGVPICTAPGLQQPTSITPDGTGGATIVWQDKRFGQFAVFAQRINALGQPQWMENGIAVSSVANASVSPMPVVTTLGPGAIVAWRDASLGTPSIMAQRITPEGGIQWAGGRLISTTPATLRDSIIQIIGDDAGGAIIVWVDNRAGAGFQNHDLYAQRINGDGVIQWTSEGPAGIPLCTESNEQNWPRIRRDGMGGAVVVWHDRRNVTTDDLYVQRVSTDGQIQWAPGGVPISVGGGGKIYPEMAVDGTGGAIITWMDYRRLGYMYDVYAQRINGSGIVMWQDDGIAICETTMSALHPTIVTDMNGGAIITYANQRGSGMDIYAQRIDSSGATQWTKNGVPVCTAGNDQLYPLSASNRAGGAIISWYDHRKDMGYAAPHIYAQNVTSTGGLGQVVITSVEDRHPDAVPTGFSLAQNFPNPFNPVTTIRYGLPSPSHVTLKVYDVLGQVVTVLVDETQVPGEKSVNWDARNISSGVYFYRLEAISGADPTRSFTQVKKLLFLK